MRRLALFVLALSSVYAQASFDLLLVADNASNTPTTRSIKRFDPVTGAYLGSFGSAASSWAGIMVVPSRHQVYAMTQSNGIFAYDYNTGDLVTSYNMANFTSMKLDNTGTRIITTNSTASISSWDLDFTGSTTVATHTGASIYRAMQTTSGGYAAYEFQSGLPQFTTFSSAGLPNSIFPQAASASIRDVFGVGYGSAGFMVAMNDGSVANIKSYSLASTGTAGFLGGSNNAGGINNWLWGAAAHSGAYAVGQDASTSRYLIHFDNRSNLTTMIQMNTIISPAGMDTYLAPEPGTWAALGLGALAVMRRRKSLRA